MSEGWSAASVVGRSRRSIAAQTRRAVCVCVAALVATGVLAAGLLTGCGDARPPTPPTLRDAGRDADSDGGPREEAGIVDASPADAALDDAGSVVDDAGSTEPDAAVDTDGGSVDRGRVDAVVWFEEVAELSGLAFEREAREGLLSLADRMSGGVCVIDVDGVPPRDLFFAARPAPSGGSRLFVARGPLDYVERTVELGLEEVGDALGCLAFDAEGDGDDDLLVTGRGSLRLFENAGGRFVDKSARLPPVADAHLYTSAAAGDVDGDGDADLFVAGFILDDRTRLPAECGPFPCPSDLGRFEGIPNLLLLRTPSGDYLDDAARLAPAAALPEMTLVVGIARLEGINRVDLWVGNDFGSRFNDRPLRFDPAMARYEDVADTLGLATNQRGYGTDTMGWSTGDVNGDGELDHVTSSYVFDSTAVYLCSAGFCEDRARSAGMDATSSTFRWGEALGDFDLDGDLDLLEATGHVYLSAELARFGVTMIDDQPPNLLENTDSGFFTPRGFAEGPAFTRTGQHRGVALVDLDEDGRLDAVMAPRTGAPIVLHNVRPPRGHWLRIALRGRGANRDAAGALVTVRHAGGAIVRAHVVGEGYLGNFDPRVHVGLPGDAPVEVEVRWPDGTVTRRPGVTVDADILVTQP